MTTTFHGPVVSTNGFTGPISGSTLATTAGTGITSGTGTVYTSNVSQVGNVITTQIYIDVTGLTSSTTAGDIIGVNDAANCHLGQLTAAQNGTIYAGSVTCIEAPATADPDIDLYSNVESTGTENGAAGSLTGTGVVAAAGGSWTATSAVALTAMPAANEYLYLVVGSAGGAAEDYSAGILLIELYGYATQTATGWS